MSIEGSPIVFSGTASATIYLDGIDQTFESVPWDRVEFDHDKLRSAANTDGSVPVFLQTFGGGIAQLTTTCGVNSARPTTPNDADIDLIKKRWDIVRYTAKTVECTLTDALALNTLAKAHKVLLDRFESHQAQTQMNNISYQKLVTLQAETFSYLTTTGLTMSGPTLGAYGSTTQNNCLIRAYSNAVTFEIPTNSSGTTSDLYCRFQLVIDQMFLKNLSDTSW